MKDKSQVLDVNVKPPVEANGSNGNGARALIHLARNSHVTRCGLDRSFFGGVIVTSKINQATCKNCLRAHHALNSLQRKACHWDREHNHRPAKVERPELVQMRIAFEKVEQMRDRILETHRLNAIEEAYFGYGA